MDRAKRRLEIAVGASVAEVLLQVALLIARGALGAAPLRIVFLALKLPFCRAAWKRQPAGYLAIWIWEIGAVTGALSVGGNRTPRVVIGLVAVVVMVLLGRAISAFPSLEWESR